jgi:hypothetical protein
MGWTAEGLWYNFLKEKEVFLLPEVSSCVATQPSDQ